MDFTAIDFETANEDLASVCQVGIVRFKSGEVVDTYSTLVDPEDDFSAMNIMVHGITERDVKGAPIFPDIYPEILNFLSDTLVVSHTAFDRVVLQRSAQRYSLPAVTCEWMDTSRVVRRAWSKYAKSGYGLANVAKDLGISFNHHDAQEDARAAGLIFVRASQEIGMDLEAWRKRLRQPLDSTKTGTSKDIKRQGDGDGPLLGDVAVFTGALTISRQRAADLAAIAGCDVDSAVTKKTTLLIVGDQDIKKLRPGEEKSTKHRKAEDLIAKGCPIRILQESHFMRIVELQ